MQRLGEDAGDMEAGTSDMFVSTHLRTQTQETTAFVKERQSGIFIVSLYILEDDEIVVCCLLIGNFNVVSYTFHDRHVLYNQYTSLY